MRGAVLVSAAASAAAIAAGVPGRAAYAFPWQDPSLPVAQRVENVISLLTVEEKVAQLVHNASAVPRIQWPPYEWSGEAERGAVTGPLGTGYPTPLGLGGTFNVSLIEQIGLATAIETRGYHNEVFNATSIAAFSPFSPVLNLVRDPRWGRNQEQLCGEDPLLGRVMGRAFVFGMNTPVAPNTTYKMLNVVAKHADVYGGPEGYGTTFGPNALRFGFNAVLDERTYRENFMPNFQGVAEAGVSGYMCSYSAITLTDNAQASNNTPACGNSWLLNGILRTELNNTQAYVISDAGAVFFQYSQHGSVPDPESAAIAAIVNGMDIELTCCGAPSVFPLLVNAVQSGRLNESALDTSLRRILPFRFSTGELDPPGSSPYEALGAANVSTPAMIELALEAARQAVVLLKNDNGALPVAPSSLVGKQVCLFGPNSNDTLNVMGEYAPKPRYITTPFMAFTALLPQSQVILAEGCNTTACPSFDPSVATIAAGCDLNVVVVGTTAYARSSWKNESAACGCDKGDAVEGECCDRYDVDMPGQQLQLLQAVHGAGKPTVLVINSASMIDVSWAQANVDAIIFGPFLGMHAGTAMAETILGLNNPRGRLTTTWYGDISGLGTIEDYSMANRTYKYHTGAVLYPFGYGLSFSTFAYSNVAVAPAVGSPCDAFTVTATLANTANLDGVEVVQAYLTMHNSSVPTPLRALANFTLASVAAHDATIVTVTIPADQTAILRDGDFMKVIEPGQYSVWLGSSSSPQFPGGFATFTVAGAPTPLASC